MAGTAVLGANLLDGLVPVIDQIRAIPVALGARQFRVFTVLRTWSGPTRGGYHSTFEDVEVELTPAPAVEAYAEMGGKLISSGLDEAGLVRLSEVSLTYTEAELCGPQPLDANVEWLIKVIDGLGQGTRTRYFVIDGSPFPDREKTIGWLVRLKRSSDAEAL